MRLRQTHDDGQSEQQRNRHAHQRREGEGEHGHDLHGERKPAHAGLAETVEGAGVERGDAAHGQHIGGAHGAGDGPIVVEMVERQNDAETHHGDRQSCHRAGQAERLGSGQHEQALIGRVGSGRLRNRASRGHNNSLLVRCPARAPAHTCHPRGSGSQATSRGAFQPRTGTWPVVLIVGDALRCIRSLRR